jgi:hypothetical protein
MYTQGDPQKAAAAAHTTGERSGLALLRLLCPLMKLLVLCAESPSLSCSPVAPGACL